MPSPPDEMPPALREALDQLPELVFADAPPDVPPSPLTLLSRQGEKHLKQIFRLNAAYEELVRQQAHQATVLDAAKDTAGKLETDVLTARREMKQATLAAIALLDALDWVHDSLQQRGDPFTAEVDAARRDGLRRLAGAGISEIPASGPFDGDLHDGVGTAPATDDAPPYHIVRVVRRGFQRGTEILRRAEVITAIPLPQPSR